MLGLLVDFNGTISDDNFWRSLPAQEAEEVQRKLFVENRDLVRRWMRGQVTSNYVVDYLHDATRIEAQLLRDILITDCQTAFIDNEILQLIRLLRVRLRVFLVTGNMDCFKAHTVRALRLYDVFDDLVISSDIGMLKTDDSFFDWFGVKYQIPITDCYLLDDDLKTGLAFAHAGGRFIRTRGPGETLRYLRGLSGSEL
ncbi:hypothetical protein UNPF46_30895 [Bradyrhizobium sp. UNPF46]|uniref:hypothetical protein n=1 Tax=Bradyrhizobium sp. UNPF46 TaxID=1141168 RepID=UPI00114F83CF|nr:hypothetical protein [Bradyrhizobium sp. UNPF46]TQF27391.1 hypothetical protein UNPF46_30895 [Bradyrhizobium sp. UNPF46]